MTGMLQTRLGTLVLIVWLVIAGVVFGLVVGWIGG